jgi:hypothetical protein
MSNPLADRNLLLGILAVQRNIIGRDALVAALQAWTAAKLKGMAQILREQNAITENQHAILEECVDLHLAQHDNDGRKSLAAVYLFGPVRDDLEAIDDPELRAGLAHVSRKPIPEPAPEPELVMEVEETPKPHPPKPPTIKKPAPAMPQPAARSGVPGCVWLVAGLALGLMVAVVAIGGSFVAIFWVVNARLENKKDEAPVKGEPIVQFKPEADQKKLDMKEPPPVKEPLEPVPPKEPPEPPAVKPADVPPKDKPAAPMPVVLARPEGFEPLFNGKDLTGWKQHALFAGAWRVEDGVLTGVAGERNYGRLETEKPQPKDFHLWVEARVIGKGLGHVTFRSPQGSRVGYDVSMSGFIPGDVRVGGLILQGPGNRTFPWTPPPAIARGQWFVLEVIAEGSHIVIKVDGKTTTDLVDLTLGAAGHIALGQHTQEPVEFRRIDLKELKPAVGRPVEAIAVTPGFTPLFNGKDLTGWKPHKITPGNWRVENGVLIGSAPGKLGGRLYTERPQATDFHLRVETRISDKGSGAVLFRCQDGTIVGYEAPIASAALYIDKTGSLAAQIPGRRVSLVRIEEAPAPPDKWVTLEIIAQGTGLVVKVDGKTTTEIVDLNHTPAPGHIVLTQNASSTIEFRKVEIKKLDPVAAAPAPAPAPFPVAEGFVPHFNGKDLTGWKMAEGKPRDWKVQDGILTGVGGNLNMLYSTRDDFADFHLRAEARINDDGFSSLMFRYPHGALELDMSRLGGYGVRLAGRADEVSKTGSLMAYEKVGMRHLVVKEVMAPPGQWFNLEIIAKGNLVTTKVNGQTAISFVNPKTDLTAGRIVLEANSTNRKTVVEYRKIEIKEFKPAAAAPPPPEMPPVGKDGFAALFNAKDLTGWQAHPKRSGDWRVEGGVLIGSAPAGGSLYSARGDYQDFHLRAEARINDKGFGRVFVRAAYDPTKSPFKVLGYETLINQRPVGDKLGTLRATSAMSSVVTQAAESDARGSDWFVLEIVARRDRVTVSVNGKAVAEFADDKGELARRGHIVLHQDANATIEFRKVEVRDLSDAK